MWIALKLALSWLIGNSIVRAVATSVILDLVQHGKELVPIALAEIKIVASNKDMTGTEKFAAVTGAVTAQFPAIGKSTVNTIIQSTYNAYTNPEIKEVQ
jgi:hypothetical protein